MAAIKDKIQNEKTKSPSDILLYREGVFYIAYEHSAWLFVTSIHNFKAKKRFVKCVSKDVVSIGFPMQSFDKWCSGKNVHIENDVLRITLEDSEVPLFDGFDEWKDCLEYETSKNTAGVCGGVESSSEKEVLTRIREFPLESKSLLECMLFLSKIKRLLN